MKKNSKNVTYERRDFVALAAKVRKAGTMQDRRKKRSKERKNHMEDGWT